MTPSVYGGLCANGRYTLISGNTVTLTNTNWGIDFGGSVQVTAGPSNVITMTQGTALNTGGNLNSVAFGNHIMISGTAIGIVNQAVEQGGGAIFPTVSSGTILERNVIDITSSASTGILDADNSGGFPGTTPLIVRHNEFNISGSGTGPTQAIVFRGSATSIIIDGNIENGVTIQFSDPLGNGDVIVSPVYFGGSLSGISSTANVRSILTPDLETYGLTSIEYVTPSAGGSNYTNATTLAASGTGGGSGWAGTAQIIGGVIVGVKTTAFGSGYTGTITVTATDSGGGSGATFTVGNTPHIPNNTYLRYLANTSHLLQHSGGNVALNLPVSINLGAQTEVTLQANSANQWNVLAFVTASFAVGSLPTCSSLNTGSIINVTGSTTSKWQAQCNGTNWLWPDGTTVSS